MRGPFLRWLPVATLASLLMPAALAGEPADARGWLARIEVAAHRANYQGTLVTSAGGVMSSSRVVHFSVGEHSLERLESLDGRQQRIVRLDDTVQTIWPQSRIAVIEQRRAPVALTAGPHPVEPRALDQYTFRPEGEDRVAGREAWVFTLEPRDALRYAQRLWVDKASGLMLRADVIGPDHGILESAGFSEVEIGVKPPADWATRYSHAPEGYRVLRPSQRRTQLEAEGWSVVHSVPGFILVDCVRRSLETPEQPEALPVLQAVFSDGLTHVSIFIEPYRERAPIDGMNSRIGATSTLRQRRSDHWVTVIGDVPSATLQAFADALESRR
ncbi:MAG: MucB/RseB C-terminal domain-containing protein [Burkholderiales bacterium]|nr:MucB/RseB C-terminal domain-containing protein [Burkholderiales bacterium]MDE2397696.1 MucB/RseB C-terminal domain-containing protein [Burkholderiales bacterium]